MSDNPFAKYAEPPASAENPFLKYQTEELPPPAGDAAAAAKPVEAATPGWLERADSLASYHPLYNVAKTAIPPVANFLVADPVRNLAADVVGAVSSPPISEKGREGFWKAREDSLSKPISEFGSSNLRIPETSTGKKITHGVEVVGGALADALGAGSRFLIGEQPTAAIAPFAVGAADALPFAGGLASAFRGPGAPKPVVQAAKAENRARGTLSDRFQSGLYEGGPSALEFVEEMQKARAAGQPMTLLDVNNPEMRGQIATTYRQGGGAQAQISHFLDQRHEGQVPRAERIIGEGLGDANTFKQTGDRLREQRSQNAKPLFDEAAQGPGLKAFEAEFAQELKVAAAAETEAQAKIAQAQTNLAGAQGSAAADWTRRLGDAQRDLAAAQDRAVSMRDMLAKARADGTLRPDATWSPYLQMLLDSNPHIKRGIGGGWDIERNKAHGRGEQPNPLDYAIKDFDEKGRPVVGAVPNMRLWMVAKEGLDAAIEQRITKKHGEVDKRAHALIQLRDGLVTELDRLNPAYKVARDQWAGDSASRTALVRGQNLFEKNAFPTDAHVAEYLGGLSAADREFVKLGIAQKLLDDVRRAPDAADKAKRVVNTDIARDRLQMLLGPDTERFLQAVEREATMDRSRFGLKGGSQTADKEAVDSRNTSRALRAGGGALYHALRGHWPTALHRAAQGFRREKKPDTAANEAVGRIVTDPTIDVNATPGGPILPPIAVPKRYWMTPGRSLAAGEAVPGPQPDDPLRRALGY